MEGDPQGTGPRVPASVRSRGLVWPQRDPTLCIWDIKGGKSLPRALGLEGALGYTFLSFF